MSDAKDEIVRAGARAQQEEKKAGDEKEVMDRSENQRIVDWARKNTTLVFPLVVKVLKPVTLQDRGQQVKIPVSVGGSLKASRFSSLQHLTT